MGRIVGLIRDGKFLNEDEISEFSVKQPVAPNVIDDTMAPLRHLVTGEVFESKSAFRRVTKMMGLEEVGNDLLSKRKQKVPDLLSEERVNRAIERAEAICSDPTKYRARQEQNEAVWHRRESLLNGK
jgi:hypothetical protein